MNLGSCHSPTQWHSSVQNTCEVSFVMNPKRQVPSERSRLKPRNQENKLKHKIDRLTSDAIERRSLRSCRVGGEVVLIFRPFVSWLNASAL